MKAVIQAGGKGTRLRDITKDEIPVILFLFLPPELQKLF